MKIDTTFKGHSGIVTGLDFKENERGNQLISCAEDSTIRLWDLRSQECIQHLTNTINSSINAVKFGSNDDVFALSDNKILRYDVRKFDEVIVDYDVLEVGKDENNELNQIVISNDDLYVCDDEGYVHGIDLKKYQVIHSELRHKNVCTSICQGNGGVISGGMDYICHISKNTLVDFSVDQSKQMFNPPAVYSVATTKNCVKLACGLGTGKISIINTSNGETICNLDKHNYSVTQLNFAKWDPNNTLVSGGLDSVICIWNIKKKPKLMDAVKHNSKINCLCTSPDHKIFMGDLTNDIHMLTI